MRIAAIDHISSPSDMTALPLQMSQTPSRRGSVAILTLLVPIALGLFAPFWLIATRAATDPSLRAWIIDHPGAVLPVLCGLVVWIALLGWPVLRLLDNLVRTRTLLIDRDTVAVADIGPWGRSAWTAPLDEFTGLAHHVRASLGGVRHELILVHPDRDRTLLVSMAPRMLESDVTRFANMLRVPVIPAAAVYRFDDRARQPSYAGAGAEVPNLSGA